MAAVYDYLEERYGALPGNEQTLRNFIRYLTHCNKLQLTNQPVSTRRYQSCPSVGRCSLISASTG